MASLQFTLRRLRRKYWKPPVQVGFFVLLIIFLLYFIIRRSGGSGAQPQNVNALQFVYRVDTPTIDWSKYAYVQYVSSPAYLCSALMIFSELDEVSSRAKRVLLYPSDWNVNAVDEYDEALDLTPSARLLQLAQQKYGVTLHPLDILVEEGNQKSKWSGEHANLLSFGLTEYERVLVLDPDSVVLQSLDELFLVEATPVAAPYIYDSDQGGWGFSSNLMLVQPSAENYKAIEEVVEKSSIDKPNVDILYKVFKDTILKIPQRPYNLLTGEFRKKDHKAYLSNPKVGWYATRIVDEAKFVHFTDEPLPKPWMRAPKEVHEKHTPKCKSGYPKGTKDCSDRVAWLNFYYKFALRRRSVCGRGFELLVQHPEST